ncbi:hypothetical protein F4604DRAFT_1907435 [Suillus subluteus]|nr:hypothetical protein F4604DRAFT_1907435 [Suillus subluteus]
MQVVNDLLGITFHDGGHDRVLASQEEVTGRNGELHNFRSETAWDNHDEPDLFKPGRHLLPASDPLSTRRRPLLEGKASRTISCPHSITGYFIKLWMHCGCGHFPGPYKKLPSASSLSLTFTTQSPLGLPTGFPGILLPYGRTAPHSFYSLQGYSILPHSGHVLPYSDYTLLPSFGLSSSMTSMKPQGSLFPSMPGCNIRASVPSAQAGPYPSRMPSSPTTSFIGRLCTPIEEEEEEEELTPVEPQDGLFPGYDISASESTPSAQAGPYPSRTPPSPSTSFIRSLCTLIEEEEEELISVEPQGGLFSGYDVSASVLGAQAGSYRTPSSPSTSFTRRLCTLIEEGEEE